MPLSTDWSRFTVRINIINVPVEKIYWAWATQEGIEYWFLRLSEYSSPSGEPKKTNEFVNKGDIYKWRWWGYSDEVTETGSILDSNGKNSISFSFGKAGNCTIAIKEEFGETMVELIQDNIPTDESSKMAYHVGCKTGWTFYLANLKSMVEGGTDLRNRNENLQDVLNS